jgi:hypothetical protein
VIAYSLTFLALGLGVCTIIKPRRYAPELLGLLSGTVELVGRRSGKIREN